MIDDLFQSFELTDNGPLRGWECKLKPETGLLAALGAASEIARCGVSLMAAEFQGVICVPDEWYAQAKEALGVVLNISEIRYALCESHLQDAASKGEAAGIFLFRTHASSLHELVCKSLHFFYHEHTLAKVDQWQDLRSEFVAALEGLESQLQIEATRARKILATNPVRNGLVPFEIAEMTGTRPTTPAVSTTVTLDLIDRPGAIFTGDDPFECFEFSQEGRRCKIARGVDMRRALLAGTKIAIEAVYTLASCHYGCDDAEDLEHRPHIVRTSFNKLYLALSYLLEVDSIRNAWCEAQIEESNGNGKSAIIDLLGIQSANYHAWVCTAMDVVMHTVDWPWTVDGPRCDMIVPRLEIESARAQKILQGNLPPASAMTTPPVELTTASGLLRGVSSDELDEGRYLGINLHREQRLISRDGFDAPPVKLTERHWELFVKFYRAKEAGVASEELKRTEFSEKATNQAISALRSILEDTLDLSISPGSGYKKRKLILKSETSDESVSG